MVRVYMTGFVRSTFVWPIPYHGKVGSVTKEIVYPNSESLFRIPFKTEPEPERLISRFCR